MNSGTRRSYSGLVKIEVCERLGDDWKKLADYFEIPSSDQRRFERGFEPEGVWDWLEKRRRLGDLPDGLENIRRSDLVQVLDQDTGEPRGPDDLPVTPPGLFRSLLDRVAPRLHGYLTRQGTLAKPPEGADFRDYLRALRARIENDFRNKVYLPLRAGHPASPLLDEATSVGDFAPIHQVIRQLAGTSRGGDSASAQIAAVNRQSRVVRNILKQLRRPTSRSSCWATPAQARR